MIEDAEIEPGPPEDGVTLLYDYFKHLTSLCLFSLGGVLALAAQVKGRGITLLIAALLVIGFAALLSFSGAGEIVGARYKGKPLTGHINMYRTASPILLSMGLGVFVYLFMGTLKL
jgi:hypothetical protein